MCMMAFPESCGRRCLVELVGKLGRSEGCCMFCVLGWDGLGASMAWSGANRVGWQRKAGGLPGAYGTCP